MTLNAYVVLQGVSIELKLQLPDNYAYMHEQITKELVYTFRTGSFSTGVHPFNVPKYYSLNSNVIVTYGYDCENGVDESVKSNADIPWIPCP